jgi:hypothetical protein
MKVLHVFIFYRIDAKDANIYFHLLGPYMPIVYLNVSNNFDWVLQSINVLSVQPSRWPEKRPV